ncbi:hypothetical protein [Bacillus altitudinis]|uniref:hypothetical protein n=1 Tax=Bacillus altitudinis TaxID=293387 RepID=UPI0011A3E15C|nr:hypothetical protein [Bacillus altitudinis]
MVAGEMGKFIEMGYEILLYEKKDRYYEVGQVRAEDMEGMRCRFGGMEGEVEMGGRKGNEEKGVD